MWRSTCGSSVSMLASSAKLATAAKLAKPLRPRVVILGSGWGGFRLAKDLDRRKFDVSVISPRNHFLFTPLLPSTTVGTLVRKKRKECLSTYD